MTRCISTRSRAALALLLLALASPAGADGIANSGSVTPGQVPATATNDNATAGNVGEYITATVAQGSAVTLTTATPANITSVALTAGDWDCSAVGARTFTTATVTVLTSSIVTVTATQGSLAAGTMVQHSMPSGTPPADYGQGVPPVRISAAGAVTAFLTADDTFSAGTNKAYGFLRCRRAR